MNEHNTPLCLAGAENARVGQLAQHRLLCVMYFLISFKIR